MPRHDKTLLRCPTNHNFYLEHWEEDGKVSLDICDGYEGIGVEEEELLWLYQQLSSLYQQIKIARGL